MSRLLTVTMALVCVPSLVAAAPQVGDFAKVKVSAPTRLDWVFAVANQSPAQPPADWLPDYDSTAQQYELHVPQNYNDARPHPLVLFISPGQGPAGWNAFQQVSAQRGVIFASPFGAGNQTDVRQRIRIVLDVLDDVRRNYNIDPDRTYLSGFSGGARIASGLSFSLPELFGGVMPICGTEDLRQESWLRHRVMERHSVALVTGEKDFNRGEVERFRGPLLKEVGVNVKVWVVPGMGHSLPPAKVVSEVFAWMDQGVPTRRQLAKKYPASRIEDDAAPSRQEWSQALLKEGKARLTDKSQQYRGLMLLKGIRARWSDLPAAEAAKSVLLEVQQGADTSWQEEDIAEQRKFLIARAKSLDAYASGPLPKQYAQMRSNMAQAAIELYKIIIQDAQDEKAIEYAHSRLPELKELVEE